MGALPGGVRDGAIGGRDGVWLLRLWYGGALLQHDRLWRGVVLLQLGRLWRGEQLYERREEHVFYGGGGEYLTYKYLLNWVFVDQLKYKVQMLFLNIYSLH